jgi:glycosyltransferase involved in cell wall biosynthesis
MRKRVVILAKYFPPERGGMETYAHALANALKNDFDVHVLAHAREAVGSDETWDGFRVRRCGTWMSVLSQPFSPSMLIEIARLKPDIVHLSAPNAFANLCWALAARDAKLVITHHADVLGRTIAKRVYSPLYRRAVAAARSVVVFSRKNALLSVDLPPIDEKLVEIPQGLDPELWKIDDDLLREAGTLRRRLAAESPVASFVGRLISYKGLDVLVRAIAHTPNSHAFIAGRGPLRNELEEFAHRIGVGERIHFLGDVDERMKRIVLLASDLLAFPSVSTAEAFGIVQVEAQFLGLPVIVSDLPSGVTDVTINEVTGLLVPPHDDAALARAMQRLFDDEALRTRLGAAGRQRALDKFSSTAFNNAYRALFQILASEVRAPNLG